MDMVVIGIDSHKSTHTAVAADGNGRFEDLLRRALQIVAGR